MPTVRQGRLKEFSGGQVLLTGVEAKSVLVFFFPSEKAAIESANINPKIRGFAQSLLVEAIDASYAMGFAQALFSATANPSSTAGSVIKCFGKKAVKHWFDSATAKDLSDVKIYESVRRVISRNFKSELNAHLAGIAVIPFSKPRVYNA